MCFIQNLKQIFVAMDTYVNGHRGHLPPDLDPSLLPYIQHSSVLQCPEHKSPYVYVFAGTARRYADVAAPEEVMCVHCPEPHALTPGCRPLYSVLFVDGHAIGVSEDDFAAKKANAGETKQKPDSSTEAP